MFETWQQIFMMVLMVVVFITFMKEWLSAEVTALLAMVLCVVAGILSVDPSQDNNALSVFAHPAAITVACMFILSAALERVGIIESMGTWFERVAGGSPLRMLVVLMLLVMGCSGFVNNTPVVVVFLPIIMGICRRKNYMASKFLIPLSYAAVAGGTVTVIGTSTNLIAAGIAEESGMEAFSMFEITPMGLVVVSVVFVYMLLIGRHLLPNRATLAELIDSEVEREFITRAMIKNHSPLIGKGFSESAFASNKKVKVLEIIRNGSRLRVPLNTIIFEDGDEMIIKGQLQGVLGVSREKGVEIGEGRHEQPPASEGEELGLSDVRTESAVIMEGIVGPESSLLGKNLRELNLRQRFGVLILAVHRRGRNLQEKFESERLTFGDTLLVQGPRERLRRLFQQKDFINLSEPKHTEVRRSKVPIVLIALGFFMVMGALGGTLGIPKVPTVLLALCSALLVLVTRCIEPQEAFDAVEWKVIFMICGMLGVGMAMDVSGLAKNIAETTVNLVGEGNPLLMLSMFYLLAMVLTEMVSNNAVAALLTPLAIYVSSAMGVDARPFVVAVMFGASASFATPIGYQTNTFVYGAGGYKFADFVKVGLPMNVMLWLIASFVIPWIWPF